MAAVPSDPTSLRRRARSHAAAALLVTLGGAWIALLAVGRGTYRLGPFEVELFARPGVGRSEVAFPPLGRIEAETHVAPIRLAATLHSVDAEAAAAIVRQRGTSGLVAAVERDGGDALLFHVGRSLGVALAGAVVGAFAYHRGRWRAAARSSFIVAIALLSLTATTYATFRPSAFLEPTYTGTLRLAPELLGPVQDARERLDLYGEEVGRIVQGVARAYEVLGADTVLSPDAVAVLHISDLHSSPIGMNFALRLAETYDVDLVVDTGDLTSFGSSLEVPVLNRVAELSIPYLLVRGNHDSDAIGAAVEALPNGDALEGEVVTVAGMRFAGIPHPLFTPDAVAEEEEEIDAAVAAGTEALEALIAAEAAPPDVVLVHDGRMADGIVGDVPLVLSGHFHRFSASTEDGTLRLQTGSTGAGGLDTFIEGDSLPLAAQILYFDSTPLRVAAVDRVALDPETRDLVVDRELFGAAVPVVGPSPPSAPAAA